MHPKIIIKLYIVLFVIDIALLGHFTDVVWLSFLAALNILFLFVVLIQERKAFEDYREERVLFRSDIFGLLALAVGVIAADLWSFTDSQFVEAFYRITAFLFGGLFYVLSVLIFGLRKGFRRVSALRIVGACIAILFVVLIGGMMRVAPYQEQQPTEKVVGFRDNLKEIFSLMQDDTDDGKVEIDDIDEEVDENEENGGNIEENSDGAGEEDLEDTDSNDEDKVVDSTAGEDRLFAVSSELLDVPLTFGNLLPRLLDAYDLPLTTDTSVVFTNVATSDSLYPAFATAYSYRMIGRATYPDQPILCQHLMVLLGLAEEWELSYTSANVFDVYWAEAERRGYTAYGCEELDQQALFANLP